MKWKTLAGHSMGDTLQRDAIDAAVLACGGSVQWRDCARAARSYAVVELPDDASAQPIEMLRQAAQAQGCTVYDGRVIALAVFPAVAEALPALLTALGGDGRPVGMRACEPAANGGVVLAWDLDTTSAVVVLAVVDAELARYASGRTIEIATPLAAQWIADIAASGLRTPEIAHDRILETLLTRHGLHA